MIGKQTPIEILKSYFYWMSPASCTTSIRQSKTSAIPHYHHPFYHLHWKLGPNQPKIVPKSPQLTKFCSKQWKMLQSGVGSIQGSNKDCLPLKGHTRGGWGRTHSVTNWMDTQRGGRTHNAQRADTHIFFLTHETKQTHKGIYWGSMLPKNLGPKKFWVKKILVKKLLVPKN